MENKVRAVGIGLVGAGAFGQFCLDAFATMPEVRIVAVADIDHTLAQTVAERYGAQGYNSLESLLENPSVEIVALNTPPYLHAEQGAAILRARRHLFCEKPLALTLADGQQLIRLAEENDVLLSVDYVMRHNPFWEAARTLAQSGVLGELRHMDLSNHAAGLALPAHHWFWDTSKSGGIWIEHGVHFFDAFTWVSGQPGEITGSQTFKSADGVANRVEALARFGEVAAHFYHAFDQSKQTEQTTVRLTLEHAYLTLREWVPTSLEILTTVSPDKFSAQLPGELSITQRDDGRFSIRAYAPEGKSSIYRQCIQAGMLDLVKAVLSPSHKLMVTGAHGLESLRLAIQASQ
jgi:predicted dehydrogenase